MIKAKSVIRWLFVGFLTVAFVCITAIALQMRDQKVFATTDENVGQDVIVRFSQGSNDVFTADPLTPTALNDSSQEGGSDEGLRLVSKDRLGNFITPFQTTGNAYFELTLKGAAVESYDEAARNEIIFTFYSQDDMGTVDGIYLVYLYEGYLNEQHTANYAVFYQTASSETKTVETGTFDFLYNEAVNKEILISVSFQPVAGKLVFGAVDNEEPYKYEDKVCVLSKGVEVTENSNYFNPYLYKTTIQLRGEIILSKFNTFSLTNTYNEDAEIQKRQFTTLLGVGEGKYVSDMGEGIIPEFIYENTDFSIHKSKLCYAFFVGSAEYTVQLYDKNNEAIPDEGDSEYYQYKKLVAGTYRVVISVHTTYNHTSETEYTLTVKEVEDIAITMEDENILFTLSRSDQEAGRQGYVDVNPENTDNDGLLLVENAGGSLVTFEANIKTTGNAYAGFRLKTCQTDPKEDEINLGVGDRVAFSFVSVDDLGQETSRYEIHVYQRYYDRENGKGKQHYACFGIFYRNPDGTIEEPTMNKSDYVEPGSTTDRDMVLPFLYSDAVENEWDLSLTFSPIARTITIAAEGTNVSHESTFILQKDNAFNPYLYQTAVSVCGKTLITKINNFSLENEEQDGIMRYSSYLGNDSYIADTGDGVIPETMYEDTDLCIHRTKLCYAFFCGSAENYIVARNAYALTYTVTVQDSLGNEMACDENDQTYYRYSIKDVGEYTIIVKVKTINGHSVTRSYSITAKEWEARVTEASLSLEGDIGLRFTVKVSELVKNDAGAKLAYTFKGETATCSFFEGVEVSGTNGTYRVFTVYVSPKDYTEKVECDVISAEGESYMVSPCVYSVEDYFRQMESLNYDPAPSDGVEQTDEDLEDLLVRMENYCETAKDYFIDKTGTEALYENEVATDVTSKLYASKYSIDGTKPDGIKLPGPNLEMASKTAIRLYFKLADATALQKYTCTVKYDNDAQTGVVETKSIVCLGDESNANSLWYVEIPNIYAHHLNRTYELTLTDGEATWTISYSAYSYIYTALTRADTDVAENKQQDYVRLLNLVRAMYLYGEAAETYATETST